jgi:hypothetical protein
VNPSSGKDTNSGRSQTTAFQTIQKALDEAEAGSTIILAPGTYMQNVDTVRDGTETASITITGPSTAVVHGDGSEGRIFEVHHDYIILDGFTIDGFAGGPDSMSNYRDKLIYVIGSKGNDVANGVQGLTIQNMTLQNAGGECVRIKYFARDVEIAFNTIRGCGVYDFKFYDGGKNGEGVYIGTAPEQEADNPTNEPDRTTDVWVHHNDIDTSSPRCPTCGNECVDVKENATNIITEYNICTGNKDGNSAGLDTRGNGNTFRYNLVTANVGAGVRLGGDTGSDGLNNDVYYNEITNNEYGGIKFMRSPQRTVCGNTMSGNDPNNTNGGDVVGSEKDDFQGSRDPKNPCPADVPPPSGNPGIPEQPPSEKAPDTCSEEFPDVPVQQTFYRHIQNLTCDGVVSGYEDGTFKPQQTVTRGQMAKFIRRAYSLPAKTSCTSFSDVSTDHTFYTDIISLKCTGIIGGFEDGTYKPEQTVTRGQAMKFIINGLRASKKDSRYLQYTGKDQRFTDVPPSHTFYELIMAAQAENIVNGFDDGTFKPTDATSRGAMSKMVDNARSK